MTFAPYAETLANLRMTAENDSLSKETKDFTNLMPTRTTEKSAEGNFSIALQRGKGSISSRVLSVQKGQKLTLSVMATYDNENTLQPLSKFANSNKVAKTVVLGAASALSIQDVNVGAENKTKTLNINILGLIPIFKNLLSPPTPQRGSEVIVQYKPQKPKSYIEIAVYKDSSLTELLHNQITSITENSEYNWENLQDSLTFKEDGFAVVSLRNESNKQVLFDDLNVRIFGTLKAAIIQENHYEPFGMTLLGLDYTLKEETKNVFLFNGKELEERFNIQTYDYHARQVDPQIGRMNSVDPLADNPKYINFTSYNYAENNPIVMVDPDGKGSTSTHTDKNGTVLAVYNDGDLGVYKHDDVETKKDVDKKYSKNNTSAGGQKMGETVHWNEFLYHTTDDVVNEYGVGTTIEFGSNWDRIIADGVYEGDNMLPHEVAAASRNNGKFSLQDKYPGVGKLFKGKYMSSESAGNYLAGANAAGIMAVYDYAMFQRIAGGLHVANHKTPQENLSYWGMFLYGVGIKSEGSYPTYGEVRQQYRWSKTGWDDRQAGNYVSPNNSANPINYLTNILANFGIGY